MAQTKLGSFAEALANIGVGFGINFCANLLVLPLFGMAITPSKAFGIGIIFTVISLVRSYILRRWFNGLKFGNTSPVDGSVGQINREPLTYWQGYGDGAKRAKSGSIK